MRENTQPWREKKLKFCISFKFSLGVHCDCDQEGEKTSCSLQQNHSESRLYEGKVYEFLLFLINQKFNEVSRRRRQWHPTNGDFRFSILFFHPFFYSFAPQHIMNFYDCACFLCALFTFLHTFNVIKWWQRQALLLFASLDEAKIVLSL